MYKLKGDYLEIKIDSGHVFLDSKKSCCCSKSANSSGIILDSLYTVENSLKCAINICNMLISTNFFIEGQI